MEEKRPTNITYVWRLPNGKVYAFSPHWDALPDYCGDFHDVEPKLRAAGYDGPIDLIGDRHVPWATKLVVTEPAVTDPFAPFDPWSPHAFVPDRNRCDVCGHSPSHPRHQKRDTPQPRPIGKDELPPYGHVKDIGDATYIFDGLCYVGYASDNGYAVRNVLTEMLLGLERRVRTGGK